MFGAWDRPRAARALATAAALANLSAGCLGASPPLADHDAGPVPYVELGTGQAAFEELPPRGGRVELVHGPQGGFHFYGRYRFLDLEPDVYVTFRVTPADGGSPINDPTERFHRLDGRGLQRAGDGWEAVGPELVIVRVTQGPADVVGRRYRWEVFVEGAASGRVTSDTREVTIVDEVP